MCVKDLIRLTEQTTIEVCEFYRLATTNNIPFEKVFKFLVRLEKFRKTNNQPTVAESLS